MIVARSCVFPHVTYLKGIGLYLQRTASTFGLILRGATGDVVMLGGGEWFETAGKASIRTRKDVWYQETA